MFRYFTCVTIAPTFFLASIYITLFQVIVSNKKHLTFLKSRSYAKYFIASDMTCLTLQTIGGILTGVANTYKAKESCLHIMVAGLLLQVFSLVVFMAIFLEFIREIYISPASQAPDSDTTKGTRRSRLLLFGMWLALRRDQIQNILSLRTGLAFATLLILIRSAFRVAELSQGLTGSLLNDQTAFVALESIPVAAAVICLTALHPGLLLSPSKRKLMGSAQSEKNVGYETRSWADSVEWREGCKDRRAPTCLSSMLSL